MKKLALVIMGLGAYIAFSASAGSLAALRVDNAAGVAETRDSRVTSAVTEINRRLLFLDNVLYPDTASTSSAVTDAQLEHRRGERAPTMDISATFTEAQLNQRQGERAGTTDSEATTTAEQPMFCEGDICWVP
jgi:hypothetical protein